MSEPIDYPIVPATTPMMLVHIIATTEQRDDQHIHRYPIVAWKIDDDLVPQPIAVVVGGHLRLWPGCFFIELPDSTFQGSVNTNGGRYADLDDCWAEAVRLHDEAAQS